MVKLWKFPGWKFPHRNILTECRKQLRSTMFTMEKVPRLKKLKSGKFQQSTVNSGSGESSGSTGNLSKSSGKGRKIPLLTDICWRCSKGRHQQGQPCKAVCRNCYIKGHFEKVCMKGKHSTHLMNVHVASSSSTSDPQTITMNMETPYMLT